MNKIREGLIALFEDMLPRVKDFNRGTYNRIFEYGFEKYKHIVFAISDNYKDMNESEKYSKLDELAKLLPDYVATLTQGLSKKEFEGISIEYNMNMAIYVVPILTYTRDRNCEYMVKKMIEYWNEIKVCSLTLGMSSYESIAGGFKKKLCYITTAVCASRNKPDDCYELTTLREYRDEYLLLTEEGSEIVEEYYDIAPGIVTIINMQSDSAEIYNRIYDDYITKCIHHIEVGKKEECCELYMKMVRNLQKQYLYS